MLLRTLPADYNLRGKREGEEEEEAHTVYRALVVGRASTNVVVCPPKRWSRTERTKLKEQA